MKKIIGIVFFIGVVLTGFLIDFENNEIEILRKKHAAFLKDSPFKKSLKLTRKERKSQEIPPNKYFEREWELTMNPATGVPEPEKVSALQAKLSKENTSKKTPGDTESNPWVERGPNNVGGRTRTLLFDPNDVTNKRVFSGGVSGGLWVNNDITNENSTWTQITGVPGNMAISCIAVDPNNTNVFYVGTGEIHTQGSVTGNGVYKSIDGGFNWGLVFGGEQPETTGGTTKMVSGHFFVQDIVVRNNGGTSEVFIGVGASHWRYGGSITTFLGEANEFGVFKSVDGGVNWTEPIVPTFSGRKMQPNDFEISADNTIWLATIGNYFGDVGGTILKSTDGNTFTEVRQLDNIDRTEIEFSSINPFKAYVLAEGTDGKPVIYKTEDAFATAPSILPKPNDVDDGIDADDFARGQSFYNLMIEVDPNNDAILYVGGIDLFRSTDSGATWSQLSKWHAGFTGDFSVVHADQHAMSFRPGNSDQAIFGNDGGVYFANTLLGANASDTAIISMNTGYNVTQFYRGAIAPTIADEYFLGGAQDNGTPFFNNPGQYADASIDISGGDGAYCFVDQVGESYLIVSYVYNNANYVYDFGLNGFRVINSDDGNDGDFINPADLDSNLDILYTNGSNGNDFRIFRYSDLIGISSEGTATKDTLSNALLDASPSAIKVSPYTATSTTILIATDTGRLLKATNMDTTPVWSDITGNQFLGSISDVEYGASENEILVTFHNFGVSNIWYSNDGGLSWNNKEGDLPDLPVKTILQNPLDNFEVIIGTDLGTWKTANFNDTAPNWVQTYNGMSDVKVTDLQLRTEDNTILATTYGRGIFTGKFSTINLKTTTNVVDNKIEIYPTITKGLVHIRTDEIQKDVSLFVYDAKGQQVLVKENLVLDVLENNDLKFSFSEGVYILKILKGTKVLKAQRIIIKK